MEIPSPIEPTPPPMWSQHEAIEMCKWVEKVCEYVGDCHVALTGGLLYRNGPRKDLDLIFYRVRQVTEIDEQSLLDALVIHLGFEMGERFGWVQKATFQGKKIDLFFPERDYNEEDGASG